jgi:putative redox protein
MELTVSSLGGDRHLISVRGHELIVDQPRSDGGEDAGPTPTDLFVASLASCVAHYARRALGREGGRPSVHCRWSMSATTPWRVTAIEIEVRLPEITSPARLAAVRRAIGHCTIHNTLQDPPKVAISAALGGIVSNQAA